MREVYEKATLEITLFSTDDVLTTSGGIDEPLGGGDNHDPEGWT